MNYKSVKLLPADTVTNDQNKGVLICSASTTCGFTPTVKGSDGTTFTMPTLVISGASASMIMNICLSSWTGTTVAAVYELF